MSVSPETSCLVLEKSVKGLWSFNELVIALHFKTYLQKCDNFTLILDIKCLSLIQAEKSVMEVGYRVIEA